MWRSETARSLGNVEARTRALFVTGFGPFGDVRFNPSGALAQQLQEAPPDGWRVTSVQLPVTFAGAPIAIERALSSLDHTPSLLLGLGVHPGRTFALERRARAALPYRARPDTDDNTHYAAATTEIDRATDLDLRDLALQLSLAGAGVVTLSNDAGHYVCERAFLSLLGCGQRLGVPSLFLHVPPDHAVPHDVQAVIVSAWLSRLARSSSL
jgi:pyroglutamyl-peptidase